MSEASCHILSENSELPNGTQLEVSKGVCVPAMETSCSNSEVKGNDSPAADIQSDDHLAAITIRPVQKEDYHRGFPAILSQLTALGEVAYTQFIETLRRIEASQGTGASNTVYVAHDSTTDKIVGCCSLLIEDKFIHSCGRVGHVEDVVVDKDYRRMSLGKRMMEFLIDKAKSQGCYKVILDCSEENTKFYESVGYSRKSVGMAIYFD